MLFVNTFFLWNPLFLAVISWAGVVGGEETNNHKPCRDAESWECLGWRLGEASKVHDWTLVQTLLVKMNSKLEANRTRSGYVRVSEDGELGFGISTDLGRNGEMNVNLGLHMSPKSFLHMLSTPSLAVLPTILLSLDGQDLGVQSQSNLLLSDYGRSSKNGMHYVVRSRAKPSPDCQDIQTVLATILAEMAMKKNWLFVLDQSNWCEPVRKVVNIQVIVARRVVLPQEGGNTQGLQAVLTWRQGSHPVQPGNVYLTEEEKTKANDLIQVFRVGVPQ